MKKLSQSVTVIQTAKETPVAKSYASIADAKRAVRKLDSWLFVVVTVHTTWLRSNGVETTDSLDKFGAEEFLDYTA